MSPIEFNNLMRRIERGDKKALELLYRTYGSKMWYIANYICHDKNYADDIVNEMLIKIWNESAKIKNIANPNAWIYEVTRNLAITFYRNYIRQYRDDINFDAFARASDKSSYETLEFADYLKCLDEVSKEIVFMRIMYYCTYSEIGKVLNMTASMVSWKYQEALRKIKDKITNPEH